MLLETNPHTLRDDTFQVQNVWVIELAHDGCLAEEVPPLAVWRCVFQSLNGHSLAVLAGDSKGPSIHFPKLSWVERKQGHGPVHCQAPLGGQEAISSSPLSVFFSGPESGTPFLGQGLGLYFLGKGTGVWKRSTALQPV